MTKSPHILVLSGAGISAESGLATFRDQGGLWEQYPLEEVATYTAWQQHPERVLEFYNLRRRQAAQAQPNAAHFALAQLEKHFHVRIVTQNVDNLHERAGSQCILHLHGELDKARSSLDSRLIYPLYGRDIHPGDLCDKGSQLRPHIVWFEEAVPLYPQAYEWVAAADYVLIIGTSLEVQPAASLIHAVRAQVPCIRIDPDPQAIPGVYNLVATATQGVPQLVDYWCTHGLGLPDFIQPS
ncbi:NAD-dependent deacetylase [Allopseudospirillum japonicum]|uniref:protein acetyllysine N-acetyltransferase n=1 Tax=Allopseudospirillum japonicum TaxID=64971 RepID=A0A1H6TUR8_9GAMM|nr:Sir2 family NAD-dependent protein deacetylase [Allopseudospirillum japonicum]SEI79482.1 NAD-dependent deacetylase [Allopseudospirillum japonicum]